MKSILTAIAAALALLAWLVIVLLIGSISVFDWCWKWCGMAVELLLSEADGMLHGWQRRLRPDGRWFGFGSQAEAYDRQPRKGRIGRWLCRHAYTLTQIEYGGGYSALCSKCGAARFVRR